MMASPPIRRRAIRSLFTPVRVTIAILIGVRSLGLIAPGRGELWLQPADGGLQRAAPAA